MANYIRPKVITKVDWAKALRTVEQKFPEVIVEPNKTTKNKGSSDSALMQEMFPASPIYAGQLTNNIAREQKVTLLAKGVVDDGGHTFGVVDRNFGLTPGPLDLDFDTSTLLDITPYWHISGSFKKEPAARKFTPQPLKTPVSYIKTYAEYEEGIVYLTNQTVGTINFNNYFSTAPYVVLTVDPTPDNQSNVNVFGLTMPTNTGLLFGLSAPYTGYVRYRAAADNANIWPRIATSAYTSSMYVYAGEHDISNVNVLTSSFNFPSSITGSIIYYATMYDTYLNKTANTAIQVAHINILSPTNFNADSYFSNYSTVKIHYLAFKV